MIKINTTERDREENFGPQKPRNRGDRKTGGRETGGSDCICLNHNVNFNVRVRDGIRVVVWVNFKC